MVQRTLESKDLHHVVRLTFLQGYFLRISWSLFFTNEQKKVPDVAKIFFKNVVFLWLKFKMALEQQFDQE